MKTGAKKQEQRRNKKSKIIQERFRGGENRSLKFKATPSLKDLERSRQRNGERKNLSIPFLGGGGSKWQGCPDSQREKGCSKTTSVLENAPM